LCSPIHPGSTELPLDFDLGSDFRHSPIVLWVEYNKLDEPIRFGMFGFIPMAILKNKNK
jgi:hypothetical protein